MKFSQIAILVFSLLLIPAFSLTDSDSQIYLYEDSGTEFVITLPSQQFVSSSSDIIITTPDVLSNSLISEQSFSTYVNITIFKDGVNYENTSVILNHCYYQSSTGFMNWFDRVFGFFVNNEKKLLGCSYVTNDNRTQIEYVSPSQYFSYSNIYSTAENRIEGVSLRERTSFSTNVSTPVNYTFVINFNYPNSQHQQMLLSDAPRTYIVTLQETETDQTIYTEGSIIVQIITALLIVTTIVISVYKMVFVTLVAIGILIFPIFLFALTREVFAKFSDTVSVKYDELGEEL